MLEDIYTIYYEVYLENEPQVSDIYGTATDMETAREIMAECISGLCRNFDLKAEEFQSHYSGVWAKHFKGGEDNPGGALVHIEHWKMRGKRGLYLGYK